jgi:hypothetical protein
MYMYFEVSDCYPLWPDPLCLKVLPSLQNFYKTDKLWLKLFVVSAWILDTAHSAIIIQTLYIYLVKNFANPLFLVTIEPSVLAPYSAIDSYSLSRRRYKHVVILAVVVDFQIQLLFLFRVWTRKLIHFDSLAKTAYTFS